MSNVSPRDFQLDAVIASYKGQLAEGLTQVSHGRVETETGVARSTCARLWRKGRRATSTAAAVPPLEKLVRAPVAAR